MPSYHFRVIAEFVWIGVSAFIVALAAAVGGITWEAFQSDPLATATALLVIAGRAAVAAVIAKLNGSFSLR